MAAPFDQASPQEPSTPTSSISSKSEKRSKYRSSVYVPLEVESAATKLIASVKALVESLTSWSEQRMTDADVSDAYVRLGDDFNRLVVVFTANGIETKELSTVPEDLRGILEACLAEDARPENLKRYLPGVRRIIANILQFLRDKQTTYRMIVSQQTRSRRSGTHSHESRSSTRSSRRETTGSQKTSHRTNSDVGLQPSSSLRRAITSLPTQMATSQYLVPTPEEKVEPADLMYTTPTASGSFVSVDSDTPAWNRLIGDPLPPLEVIPLIKAVFSNKQEVKVICDLRGDEAQTFVDAIHKALDLPDFPQRLREKCLSALYRICGRCAILPSSLQIRISYNRSGNPLYRGGFADVWKEEHQGRYVAVKVLRVYSASDVGKISSRFCQEVVTWNALSHPNVLPFLGVTMEEDQLAMISEWMVNGNINEFLRVNWEANPFKLLREVADGLMYIHGRGMIHGDLKGLNILIDQDRNARLADFGLLTVVSDHTNFTTQNSAPTGGTTRWMSPELLNPEQFGSANGRPTKASDCYALGMVIYEVLTGQPPFAQSKDHLVTWMVTDGERPKRPEGVKGTWFTDSLWEMLNLCWAANSKNRPSIKYVGDGLEQISSTWEPLPPQANGGVGEDEDDDLTVLYSDLTI